MVLQNNSSDSESSDSDDDRLAQLREAADNDLINDNMFQLDGKKLQDDEKDSSSKNDDLIIDRVEVNHNLF